MNTNDGEISTYYQNVYDSLYLMYASFCFEKLYNFWDRIGDKIATIFPGEFESKRSIMFATVIDKIKSLNLEDERISWLICFRENEFKEFNNIRKTVVHYEQLETKYYEAITGSCDNRLEIEKLWNDKYSLPEFFSRHIGLTNKGIENAFMFIKNQ